MNLFHFGILAIRKAGIRRFFEIAAVKGFRSLFERRIDDQIRTVRAAGNINFNGAIPLEPAAAQRFKITFPLFFSDYILRAQQYRSRRFQFLGASFEYEGKIEWHRDPASKKVWQKKNYREIALYYDDAPPDVKPVWELNRHQYFVTLAQAYYLSGDRTYADELVSQWLDWIEQNPYRVGVNWASPLEIGLRLISWTLAFQFIEGHLSRDVRAAITSSMVQQASFLASHLSIDKVIRTNHLIGEAAGLFIAASSFSFESSARWIAASRHILEKEIQTQIFDDGVGKEQSASYHRFISELFLLAFINAKKKSSPFSPAFAGRLQKMLRWLCQFQTPSRQMPPFGDSDDGRGFLLSPSANVWDVRGLIAAGGFALNSEELAIPEFLNDEAFWFFNEREWTSAIASQAKPVIEAFAASRESGHVVMRDSEGGELDYCFFRAGPFGLGGDGFCSHSHNDLFSPILYLNGESILTDTGTSVYHGNDDERNYLRSAAAHNTTVNDGWNLFESQKWFGWKRTVNGKIVRGEHTDQEMRVECTFEGPDVIPYSRAITYRSRTHSFRIEDTFDENVRRVHTYFHLDPALTVECGTGQMALIKGTHHIARFVYPDIIKPEVEEGWISRSYGAKERALIIHCTWDAIAKQPLVFEFEGTKP